MNFEELLFLKDSYNQTLYNYNEVLNNKKAYGWDWIIITASNSNQAKSYETQIKHRKANGLIPNVRIDIIPDVENKRIGSGGATLNVLKFLNDNDKDWINKKILLIHSGGDSKRVPQYSACGKLFSHVPRSLINNKPSTLFDEFLVSLSLVPERLTPGILVVSGDVLLLFNYLQIDMEMSDCIAISMKEKVEIGKNHGVFLSDEWGTLTEFLHKNSVDELKNKGAIDNFNMVDIDTGLIWMNSKICIDLLNLIQKDGKSDELIEKKYINDVNRLSFYGDLLYPLSKNGTLDKYLKLSSEGVLDDNLIECRKNIWNTLNKYCMKVIKTSPSKFIHVGTTVELLNLNTNASSEYSFLNWENSILSNKISNTCSFINSYIKDNVIIGNHTFIEDSIIENANIGSNCIITGAKFSGNLPDNTVLQILPLIVDNKNCFVSRIYGICDNPKEKDKFLASSISDFLSYYNIDENVVFDSDEDTLWDANLYSVCNTIDEAIDSSQILLKIVNKIATYDEVNNWIKSNRLSLKHSYSLANMNEITNFQDEIDIIVRTNLILTNFKKGISIYDCCKYINEKNVDKIVNQLINIDTYDDYKISALLSFITEKYSNHFPLKHDYYENECYSKIKTSIYNMKEFVINEPKDEVFIENPVRINFGGGWSDTPPYCIENGGTVLNAAILLNNEFPIKVSIKKYKKGAYKFNSIDLRSSVEYTDIDDLKKLNAVGDPFILSKASIQCLNIFSSKYLEEFGIEITTNVNVPKGSGLGTSSILVGSIIKALVEFYSIDVDLNEIIDLTLKVEQLISTGGGWQDQIGGLIPGIKLIQTVKGQNQKYNIQKVNVLNINELEERIILVYTGQRRIAKNLLRRIMNKYIYNEKNSINVLNEIQHLALIMKYELEKGNIDRFAEMLTEHFKLIRKMDDGVSNVCIDHIIQTIEDYLSGYTIAGAGGGGFIFAIMKKGVSRDIIQDKLESVYKENGVKIYDCSLQ